MDMVYTESWDCSNCRPHLHSNCPDRVIKSVWHVAETKDCWEWFTDSSVKWRWCFSFLKLNLLFSLLFYWELNEVCFISVNGAHSLRETCKMGITTCAFFKNTAMQVKAVTVVHFSAFYTYIYINCFCQCTTLKWT